MAKTSFYSGSGPDSNDVSALENLKNQAQTSATNAASSASSAAASASSAAASVASLNEDVATQSTKGLMSAADKTKLDGIESNADVTDSDNVTAAGALMDSEVTSLSGIKTLTVPDSTTVSTFGASLVDDADAAAARTTLGLGSSDSPTFAGMTLDGDAVFGTNDRLSLGIQSGTNALQIYYFGDSFIENNAYADLLIRNNTNNYDVRIQSDNGSDGLADYFVADGSTGAAQLYWGDYSTNSGADGGLKLTSSATGIDVTGNIIVSGTVDGRDVAADGVKLDTVETNADVTDAANVQAAGALMDSELTSEASVKAINQGLTTTDSPTFAGVTADVTGDVDLSAIAATIADTAVDVFVYDTRKDSDGGAWRKRTQHTSWYNETLNTATRGSRKEFPAVAVIVAESNQVTIYDGDDPDLPMWMVFNRAGGLSDSYVLSAGADVSCMSAFNGTLVAGQEDFSGRGGLRKVQFVSDQVFLHNNNNTYQIYNGYISERNDAVGYRAGSLGVIVDRNVNDVAMTVLPNAPIDAATGLPVPTIAVATAGGHSFILDNGNVVDLLTTTYTDTDNVSFTDKGRTYNLFNDGGFVSINELPSEDISSGSILGNGARLTRTASPAFSPNFSSLGTDIVAKSYDEASISTSAGLTNLQYTGDTTTSMVAYTTSDYNTGWMNGDIKLATLSDTDDTDVTGSELVTNGTFDSDTSGWTAVNSTLSVVSNALRVTVTTGGSIAYAYQALTTEVGKVYTATANVVTDGSNGNKFIFIGTAAGSNNIASVNTGGVNSTGVISVTFTATSTTTYISLLISTAAASAQFDEFDDVSVRLAEEDRSVNGNGLQVFGTVTKDPVATGADLVGYSGFSGNNYLIQPYNSDITWDASEDYCFMMWAKFNTGNSYIFDIDDPASSGDRHLFQRKGNTDDTLNFSAATSSYSITDSQAQSWNCYCLVRRSNLVEIWVNGVLVHSGSNVASQQNTDAVLALGNKAVSPTASTSANSIALFRFSKTAPSPEQIKKIYEDEKVLFQDGAQATLYGSSDAVTALAYDDSTELLHVGTSAGRSVFQGLRRVDNTTTAVGAAISASNGLVADE